MNAQDRREHEPPGDVGGLVNAHTHVYSGLAPLGMPPPRQPPRDFVQILERVWWRLDRTLDEASLRAAARLYVAEALLAGTTVLVDHHESPAFIEGSLDVLADACQELGMRAVLCYGATERNGGPDEARRGLAECRRFASSNRRSLVRGIVGLHASFTVSDDTVREAGHLCRELGTVLHVHVAEDHVDVADAQRRGHAGPFERLAALGALPAGSILAHGVHLEAEQVSRAQDMGCWLVQNPRSNRHNGVGYPRGLVASRRVALGTDGFPADLIQELDALLALAVEHGDDAGTAARRLPAGAELAASFFGGAASAGHGSRVPRVAAAPAGTDAWTGRRERTDDVRSWASARRRGVTRRFSADGRLVVDHGRLVTADVDRIRADAEREAVRLWERLRADA